jgi:predicted nucleotidyltransferase
MPNLNTKKDILAALREMRDMIKTRYKVKEIGIFGSVVRDEQRTASDIDILVEFDDGADLFDLVGLSLFLEEKLQRKVDIVPKRALRPELREAVLKEVAIP